MRCCLKLTADIDLSGKEWTPIGYSLNPFKGHFNGDDHTVSNLYIHVTSVSQSDSEIGLFGCSKGEISNLNVTGSVYADGYDNVAGICGINDGTISECSFSGSVYGANRVGGICGWNRDENIDTMINQCYSTGRNSSDSIHGTGTKTGGICGENKCNIWSSYNTCNVEGGAGCVGGLCGLNNGGSIYICYNLGDVTGTRASENIGGVCGQNGDFDWQSHESEGYIVSVYSAGRVSSVTDEKIGGICGYNTENSEIRTGCYNRDFCPYDAVGDGYSQNTTQLKALTTIEMTCSDALTNTNLGNDFEKADNNKTDGIAYYPDLNPVDDHPSIKYTTKLALTVSEDSDPAAGELGFEVCALVKFAGMSDFRADASALTSGKGAFTVSYEGTELCGGNVSDNTVKSVTYSGSAISDEQPLTFTLTYDGTFSDYLNSSNKTYDFEENDPDPEPAPEPEPEPRYPVDNESVVVKTDRSEAEEGEKVTVTVEPGYIAHIFDESGNEIATISGTGSFKMPAGGVKITSEYPISLALTWRSSYIYAYDSDMNYITVNKTKKQGVITVDLGSEYAGRSFVIYKGKNSTAVKVTEGTLDENGRSALEVEDGKNYSLVLTD